MARLINPIFKIKGSVGNLKFREVDGETEISAAAGTYNIVSEEVIANNNKFDFVLEIYRNTCGTKLRPVSKNLKLLWNRAKQPRKPVTSFFTQKNMNIVNSIQEVPNAIISPCENCFPFPASELQIHDGFYYLVIPSIDASLGLNPDTENYFEVAGFVSMTEPLDGRGPIALDPILSDPVKITYNQEMNIPLRFASNNKDYYKKAVIYLVLMSLTEKDNPVRSSVKQAFMEPTEITE